MTDNDHPMNKAVQSKIQKREKQGQQEAEQSAKKRKRQDEIKAAWLKARPVLQDAIAECQKILKERAQPEKFRFEIFPLTAGIHIARTNIHLDHPNRGTLFHCVVHVNGTTGAISATHHILGAKRPTSGGQEFDIFQVTKSQWAKYITHLYNLAA